MNLQNPESTLDFILSLEKTIPNEIYTQILQTFANQLEEEIFFDLEEDEDVKDILSLEPGNHRINKMKNFKHKLETDLLLKIEGSSLDKVEENLINSVYNIIDSN